MGGRFVWVQGLRVVQFALLLLGPAYGGAEIHGGELHREKLFASWWAEGREEKGRAETDYNLGRHSNALMAEPCLRILALSLGVDQ